MTSRAHRRSPSPAAALALIATLGAAFILIGCDDRGGATNGPAARTASSPSAAQSDAVLASDVRTLRFKIEGMTCQACVRAITKEIQKHQTVQTCIVSLEDNSALVVTRSAHDATLIPEAISCLGYEAVLQDGEDDTDAEADSDGADAGEAAEHAEPSTDTAPG